MDPDQSLVQLDHSLVQSDHSLVQLDHNLVQSDHSLVQSYHSLVQLDHSLVQLDHSLVQLDHSLVQPDHILVQPDHILVQLDQNLVQPDYRKSTDIVTSDLMPSSPASLAWPSVELGSLEDNKDVPPIRILFNYCTAITCPCSDGRHVLRNSPSLLVRPSP